MKKYLAFDIGTNGRKESKIGLSPFTSRVTCIGLKSDEFEKLITHPSEKAILEEFWELIRSDNYILVGFNCNDFDVSYLYKRSLLHQVKVVNLKGKCIDLRIILANNNKFSKGKLTEYAWLIGYQVCKSGFSKSNIGIYWKGIKIPELNDKLLDDVRLTYALFQRVQEVGLI